MENARTDNRSRRPSRKGRPEKHVPRSERLALKQVLEETANPVNEVFEIERYMACEESRNSVNGSTYLNWKHLLDVDNLQLSMNCRNGEILRMSVFRGDRILECAETPRKMKIRLKDHFIMFAWIALEGTQRFQVKLTAESLRRFTRLLANQPHLDYTILDADPPSSDPDFSQTLSELGSPQQPPRALPPSSSGFSIDVPSLALTSSMDSNVKTFPIYSFSRSDASGPGRHWLHLSSVSGLELSLMPGQEPCAIIERGVRVLERITGQMTIYYTGHILAIKYTVNGISRRLQIKLSPADVSYSVEYFQSRGISVTCSETIPATGTTYIASDYTSGF